MTLLTRSFYKTLTKMKKNVASFRLVCKISEKNHLVCCFLSAKNITFLCRFVIKYRYFFQRVQTVGFKTIPWSINYCASIEATKSFKFIVNLVELKICDWLGNYLSSVSWRCKIGCTNVMWSSLTQLVFS